eukprot:1139661-Pelagomonas_calceolata.AAC.2
MPTLRYPVDSLCHAAPGVHKKEPELHQGGIRELGVCLLHKREGIQHNAHYDKAEQQNLVACFQILLWLVRRVHGSSIKREYLCDRWPGWGEGKDNESTAKAKGRQAEHTKGAKAGNYSTAERKRN